MDHNMKALVSIAIFEKDINGDVLLTWTYPELGTDLEKVALDRCGLHENTIPLQYSFSKYKSEWLYNFIQINNNSSKSSEEIKDSLLSKVEAFSICVDANDYNPEKYYEFCKLLASIYSAAYDPVKLLEAFLSVFAKGSFNAGSLGSFNSQQFDSRAAYLVTLLKDVVRFFGEESILIWSALLMKKRIVVYSQKLGILLKLIRAFPLFVWHRQNWDLLRPFMTLGELEVADIKNAQVYCAGFTTDQARDREDLYDIFIDVNNRSVQVSSHAKPDFIMTRIHKDIYDYLIANSEDQEKSDAEFIKGLTMKTKELLTKLESLKTQHEDGKAYIDWKSLESVKLPANVDKFLYAVATAEGMTKMQ